MITKELIEQLAGDLSTNKVLVVGDVMLDRYWFGEVTRVSPEAPVPIAKINRSENRAGGAANVARNIASLGGKVTLLSVTGDDEAAQELESLLQREHLKAILKKDETISTIVKLRVLARNQQLIRIDFEENPSHEILAEILDHYEKCIDKHEVVILSDYGKGGLSHTIKMIEIAKARNKVILVDPKGENYLKYKGATLLTPNKSELRAVAGSWSNEEELKEKALKLKDELDLEYLLLTRSEEGMTLFTDSKVQNYTTRAQEIYDVSGAGDTVIATLGLMLANNLPIEVAIEVANIAAGVVIGKLGTAKVEKHELIQATLSFLK